MNIFLEVSLNQREVFLSINNLESDVNCSKQRKNEICLVSRFSETLSPKIFIKFFLPSLLKNSSKYVFADSFQKLDY